MKGLIVVVIVLAVIGLVIGGLWLSAHNQEVSLRNKGTAQQKNLENMFDKTWKIISQQAQISEEAKEAFKEVYPALMEGRYGNARGGALLSFIQEQNPNFEIQKNYDTLAASVEAQRTAYAREQEELLVIKQLHDDVRTKAPTSWFVGGRQELVVKIVTSSKTDAVFATGKDDDVDLFKRE